MNEEILNAHEAAVAWGNGERLEYETTYGEWTTISEKGSLFTQGRVYRRAPKTITVNGHEVPEPMKGEPPYHTVYCVPDPNGNNTPWQCRWIGGAKDNALLSLGMCHATREAAIKHGKALADDDNT